MESIKKISTKFNFVNIAIYSSTFLLNYIVFRLGLFTETNISLQNIDCNELYKEGKNWLTYFDIIIGIFLVFSSGVIAEELSDLSRIKLVSWTIGIVAFVALISVAVYVPWYGIKANSELHKNRVILTLTNEISKGDMEEIPISMKYKETKISYRKDSKNAYQVINISNDSVLRKKELPLKFLETPISDFESFKISLFNKKVDDIYGVIVISNNYKNKFFLKDQGNNILGWNLEIIRNIP